MNGSSHLTIGIGVAVAVTCVAVKNNDIMLCATAMAAPVGAMLPDIDHNNSKIGSQRKEIIDMIRKITVLAGLGAFGLTLFTNFVTTGTFDIQSFLWYGLLPSLVTWAPVIICIIIATSDGVKKRFKFFAKHRGIMHTLIPVIGLYVGAMASKNMVVSAMLINLGFGYTSHLFADMETVRGCPVLWPFSSENISLLKVTTGTFAEKLVLLLDLGGLACLAYLL